MSIFSKINPKNRMTSIKKGQVVISVKKGIKNKVFGKKIVKKGTKTKSEKKNCKKRHRVKKKSILPFLSKKYVGNGV